MVGYSNDFSAAVIEPSLTSLDQHTIEMGNITAQHFLKQIGTKPEEFTLEKTQLKPKLIVRESSRRK